MSTSSTVPLPSLQSPGGGALAELLDLRAEHRAALQQQLEAVVVGRVVAAGDLDAAVDVEIMGREIEHGRGPMPICIDVDPAFGEAADQLGFEHRANGCARRGRRRCVRAPSPCALRGIGPAERVGVGLGQRVADDPADVIFAQDGGVEVCGSLRCLTQRQANWFNRRPAIGSICAGIGNAEPGDHLAQLLAGGDVARCRLRRAAGRSSRVRPLGNSSR